MSSFAIAPAFRSPRDVLGRLIGRKKRSFMARLVATEAASSSQTQPRAATVSANTSVEALDTKLGMLSVALGLTAGGAVFPPLTLLGLPVYLYAAGPMITNDLYTSLVKERRVSMASLEFALIGLMLGTGHIFAATLGGFLYLYSKKLILKTEDQSRKALVDVFGQQGGTICVQRDGVDTMVPIEAVEKGELVVVNAGEIIPVDGNIVDGMAGIDQHVLTGEAQMVEKEVGDPVFASTIVLTGRLLIAVEKAGAETAAAQIAEILLQTADFKMSMHSRGEAIADRTALPTLTIGSMGFLSGLSPIAVAALMNANFGYNMRVLAPITMLNYLKQIAKRGILVKDGRAIELLSQVDTVVFDKTGTLTQEQPHIGHIHTVADYTEEMVLRFAASAECNQTHPIAKAILHAADVWGLDQLPVDQATYTLGYGLVVTIGQQRVHVGSPRFMETQHIPIPPTLQEIQQASHHMGYSLVMVAIDHHLAGAIELHTTVRPEAPTLVKQLRQHGITSIYIISGDQEEPTRRLAQSLGVDDYFANVLPENKADLIKALQAEGKTVCYVGDGINDAIALEQSQVSVSLSGASTIATDTAAIVLLDGTLAQLDHLFEIAQHFEENLRRSLWLTILPGLVSMSGVLVFHFGIVFTILLNQVGLAAGMTNAFGRLDIQETHDTTIG